MTKVHTAISTTDTSADDKPRPRRTVKPPAPQFAQKPSATQSGKTQAPGVHGTSQQPGRSKTQSGGGIAKLFLGNRHGFNEAARTACPQAVKPQGSDSEQPVYLIDVLNWRPPFLPFESEDDQGWPGRGSFFSTLFDSAEVNGAGESLDCSMLAHLLPEGADDGLFDVWLPNGDRLAVAVSRQPSLVSYLLKADSETLASTLRRKQTELEGHVGRRIRGHVRITVL